MNLDTLAEAYLRNHEEDFWAWEEVHRAVETDLNTGWKIILFLLERAASESDVQYVAAGPLEDLIDRYGHKALDLAKRNARTTRSCESRSVRSAYCSTTSNSNAGTAYYTAMDFEQIGWQTAQRSAM